MFGEETPIEALKLSTRSYFCLKRQGVETIADVQALTPEDIAGMRNFGVGSQEEVRNILKREGIKVSW